MPYVVPLQGKVGGKRTLVLLDDLEKAPIYSLFFDDLSARGHVLSYEQAESANLQLKSFGEYLYDNIVFFAPAVDKLQSLTFEDVVSFSEDGGNIMIAVSRDVSDSVRDMVEIFGISLDKKGTEVIDHFETVASMDASLQHTHILARNAIDSPTVLGAYAGTGSSQPVLYHGVGQFVADSDSILALPVLRGNPSTYSSTPNKAVGDSPESAGAETLLVTAVQGRNNARVVVSGSLDMFSNAYFRAQGGNQLFCSELSKWTFGETGVLRFRDITHMRSDGVPPDVILHEKVRPDLPQSLYPDPELTRNSLVYRIKDEIVYSMVVEQFTGGAWEPFSADDMQMEFVMLDPYVRKTLTANKGIFSATFIAPDSYGIFKFRVMYRRPGFSVLHAETQVSIRPFKHDEYERFIFSAYPYYSSALSATIAIFVFSVFFLYSSDKK
ncbi:Dolichyl-diphosphooligosaccharide--protein glycosyltransferase subunit WBP1 [Ochromonadaceae sp. CCMP2298]|nr:Dolichyl-diphosphooligosaccharide--protein glycosyltransferase subunit WBP1 [Ochromonadaceae sp. CCMP2298]